MTTTPSPVAATLELDFHGTRLAIAADHRRVVDALTSRFQPFQTEESERPSVSFDIRQADRPVDHPGNGRVVYESDLGDVVYSDADDTLVIRCDRVFVNADLRAAHVEIRYLTGADDELALAAHPLFTLPLLEILKRRLMFSLHAACVADERGGILLAGESGSGKSTTSLALALAGSAFLSDDMVFLDDAKQAPQVLGFPDEFDLTDETVRRFATLRHLDGRPTWGGRPKHQVRADELGVRIELRCTPRLLLFPEITDARHSSVEPLAAGEALIELAPNVLLTEATSSQGHLDALGALVRSVPTHRLLLGRDLDDVVATVSELAS
jgi:hypothetical protein